MISIAKALLRPLGLFVFALMVPASAHAHHMIDGKLPASFAEGLFSGLNHPVIGLDHLAFVIAVGLAAAFVPGGVWAAIAFIAATVLGVFVHLQAVDLPYAELFVAGSVCLAGGLVAAGWRLPGLVWGGLFAVAGLFHGNAYGESIVGAEPTPLAAYMLGFAVIQTVIIVTATMVSRYSSDGTLKTAIGPRIAGGAVLGVGLVFLAENALPF